MTVRLAIDTGGTFCDLVAVDDETGKMQLLKVSSTPADPSQGIAGGLSTLADGGLAASAIDRFFHGTTVATNALLEGRGARVGLAVTSGFRGIYEAMEQSRPYGQAIFDLGYRKPSMLAPQSRTAEIAERIGSRGQVVRALDEQSVMQAIAQFEATDVDSVAICFLFSFMNPQHEQRVRDLIRASHPEWNLSVSSELLPQIREYPRLSTTVIDAYVAPVVQRYSRELGAMLDARGLAPDRRYAMLSNGGSTPLDRIGSNAAATIMSGPAGGVTAGLVVGGAAGIEDLITFDMGGTSCDVALIQDGAPARANRTSIGGRDLALSMLDIATVSAGGGTLARVDDEGRLHLGPDSAGAVPGPVCYGRGGLIPTVTDADLVLGYLKPDTLLGGSLSLDIAAARRAIQDHIADPLGIDLLTAAAGIVSIVNVSMAEAIRAISTQRGHDVRDFTLVPFGGAGPMHACQIAVDLGIAKVLVPIMPGVFSAYGLLNADVRHEHVQSRLDRIGAVTAAEVTELLQRLEGTAREGMAGAGFRGRAVSYEWALEFRYVGQGNELAVGVERLPLRSGDLDEYRRRFDATHARRHGTSAPDQPVEIVNYRVVALGRVPRVAQPELKIASDRVSTARVGQRRAVFPARPGRAVPVSVYDRSLLAPGHRVTGPAIIEQYDTTTVICPEQDMLVDRYGNLVVTLRAAA
jgi:N-methylhydantoinase A